MATYEINI